MFKELEMTGRVFSVAAIVIAMVFAAIEATAGTGAGISVIDALLR